MFTYSRTSVTIILTGNPPPPPIDFDDIESLLSAGPATTSEEQDVGFTASDSFIQLQGNNNPAKETAADGVHGNSEEVQGKEPK